MLVKFAISFANKKEVLALYILINIATVFVLLFSIYYKVKNVIMDMLELWEY